MEKILVINRQQRSVTIERSTPEYDGWVCTVTVTQSGCRPPGADVTVWDAGSISVRATVAEYLDGCVDEELAAVVEALQEAQGVVRLWGAESGPR